MGEVTAFEIYWPLSGFSSVKDSYGILTKQQLQQMADGKWIHAEFLKISIGIQMWENRWLLCWIAQESGIPLHVDACLGGFLVAFADQCGRHIQPFDFR